MQTPIFIRIKYGNALFEVETYINEYRNLMLLLRDQLILDEFGVCGGMGRCGTCVINTENIKGDSANKDRNEPVTLTKMGLDISTFRLSCQLLINDDLNGAVIEIIEDY
jgi:ferredoxin, 2Fe-2S